MMDRRIKTRIFPEHNYKGIYHDGKTIRIALNPKKPITELKYPEFYDVCITQKCNSGINGFGNGQNSSGCEYCYQNSTMNGKHALNALNDIDNFFGKMTDNQRPFQVAIGGGEPTLHPDFISILKKFYDLGITPNYTTNGMHIDGDIVEVTKKYCGGVALSCHKHLEFYWAMAVNKFRTTNIKLNFHNIISDRESIDDFLSIYGRYGDKIEYFVLLPYMTKGRAKKKEINADYLFDKLDKIDRSKIAFGANFYPYLKSKKDWDISLYEPEILSKYLDVMDMSVHKSSFA